MKPVEARIATYAGLFANILTACWTHQNNSLGSIFTTRRNNSHFDFFMRPNIATVVSECSIFRDLHTFGVKLTEGADSSYSWLAMWFTKHELPRPHNVHLEDNEKR